MSPRALPARPIAPSGLCRAGLAILAFVWVARAQTLLDPFQGGTEFAVQGEYAAKAGNPAPVAAQVIALGARTFQAVFLPGGLPGQGWNGKDRIEAPGAITNGKAEFSGQGFTASIDTDGVTLIGRTDKGDSFTLARVERRSPTLNAPPPAGAVVLFDGKGVSAWKDGTASMDQRNLFKPEGSSAASGAVTRQSFGSFTLHLEFMEPFMPAARGQRRGNSGIYLQGRDELQVLDSFGNALDKGSDTMAAKRECGAFFEYFRPSLNMAYPPLSWQTYDIEFIAAKYDAAGKTKVSPAFATVRWNGVVVQEKSPLANSTLLGDPQSPEPGPLRFQAYGDSVYYRNIWVTEGVSSVIPRTGKRSRAASGDAGRPVRANGRIETRPAYGSHLFHGPSRTGEREP
ncbi:MAG: hypothetical protein JWP91_3246 [Fibrobacteres bacterium]|nr:hypothetical protein [Fibrobacterota bacterium]